MEDASEGCTALHLACQNNNAVKVARMGDLLLAHGAEPFVRQYTDQTPLELLEMLASDYGHSNDAAMRLLTRATGEPQRSFVLSKARHFNETLHVLSKVATKMAEKGATTTTAECRAACLAKTPVYLQKRVMADEALPLVVVRSKKGKREQRPWERQQSSAAGTVEEEGKKDTFLAILQYVLHDKEACGEDRGMGLDVFEELVNMIAPQHVVDEEGQEE
jgi:hypothetical protein